MRVIPAIDLLDGNCVRLFKGEFDQQTKYSDDPLGVARRFAALSVTDLHVVDLDGARSGHAQNTSIVKEIATNCGLTVQLGGGIRSAADIDLWLQQGVARCVIGSAAMTRTDEVCQWIEEFGAERIVLALDIKMNEDHEPMLTSHGWTKATGMSLWECLASYAKTDVCHVLCTDVDRDGAMLGPNFDLYAEILQRFPALQLQASGGIRHVADLHQLQAAKVPAAITGRALLEGAINPQEVASLRQSA